MNPYLEYEGNVVLGVSGGRTSGRMLHDAIAAHGGKLPPAWRAVFCNTGDEREETLRFVRQMSDEWSVQIIWAEWRPTVAQVKANPTLAEFVAEKAPQWTIDGTGFEVVGLNSASRNGEPFEAMTLTEKYLPNTMSRICTKLLKVQTTKRALLSLGWTSWTNLVGLRHDEGHRIIKRIARESSDAWKEPYRSRFPLDKARVAKADVAAFWGRMPFDLGIPSHGGNCRSCFLMSRNRLMWREREAPGTLDFFDGLERRCGSTFVKDHSYADLKRWVREQPLLIEPNDDGDDSECTDACESEAA